MIIQKVIDTQKRNAYAVTHCEMDFKPFMHSSKQKAELSRRVADAISPILLENRFCRKRFCFVRLHGDALLQIVGVQYSIGQFGIYTYAYPMYDIFKDMLNPNSSTGSLIGLKRDYQPCVRSLEAIIGINEGVSLLNYQKEFDEAIEAEVLILREHAMEKLNNCQTASDAIAFNYDKRWPEYPLYLGLCVSMYLREGKSVKEIKPIQQFLSNMLQRGMPQDLYDAIQNPQEEMIRLQMKSATMENYAYICNTIKSFGKHFALPL